MPGTKLSTNPIEFRAASLLPESFDAKDNTIDVIWFTEPDAIRTDLCGTRFIERLHPEGCNLSRLNAGAVFAWNHPEMGPEGVFGIEPEDCIGNVVPGSAAIANQGRAKVRLSDLPAHATATGTVARGYVRGISAAYSKDSVQVEEPEDGLPILHVLTWTPFELSAAPIQQDTGATTRNLEVPPMPNTDKAPEFTPVVETPVKIEAAPEAVRALDVNAIKADERARFAAIKATCRALSLPDSVGDEYVASDMNVDAVRAALINKRAEADAQTEINPVRRVVITRDQTDTLRESFVEGLAARAGNYAPTDKGARFAGKSIASAMRIYLREGMGVSGTEDMEPAEIIDVALGMRAMSGVNPSDMNDLLTATGQRNLRRGYTTEGRDFESLCRFETVKDFRPVSDIQFGALGSLKEMEVGGTPEMGTFTSSKETYSVRPWGRGWRIARTALINDDLGAFGRLPIEAGKMIRRAELDEFWAAFVSGVLSDGKTCCHADHKNVTASGGGVPSVAEIAKGVALMAAQKDLSGSILNNTPNTLIVPKALWAQGAQITGKISPVEVAGVVPQIIGGMNLISQGRLDVASPKVWYLADSTNPCFVFATLASAPDPRYRSQIDFRSEGLEVLVNYDFSVSPVDYRSLYRNKGEN